MDDFYFLMLSFGFGLVCYFFGRFHQLLRDLLHLHDKGVINLNIKKTK